MPSEHHPAETDGPMALMLGTNGCLSSRTEGWPIKIVHVETLLQFEDDKQINNPSFASTIIQKKNPPREVRKNTKDFTDGMYNENLGLSGVFTLQRPYLILNKH